MKKRTLTDANPTLKDPQRLAEFVCRMVEGSSAIEGINVKLTYKDGKFISTPQVSS
jgi:hypothetical protein